MIQSSVPSTDLKNALCPGPNTAFVAFFENTGEAVFDQWAGFKGSPPSCSVNNPNAYSSVQQPLAEYTRNTFPVLFFKISGPSFTSGSPFISQEYSGAEICTLAVASVHGSDM